MPYDGTNTLGNAKVRAAVVADFFLDGKVTEGVLARAERLQWVHSSFKDLGDDWNRADFYNAAGAQIDSVTIPGY